MTGSSPGWALELLGPARLTRDGEPVDLGSPQRLALLAVLALAHGHPSGMQTLVDAVWGAEPPPRADVAVRSHVSVLRRILEPGRAPRSAGRVVVTRGGGYALAPAVALDVTRFRGLVAAARQRRRDDPEAARTDLSAALGLWRGEALGGLPGPSATLARALLADERLHAWEDLLEIELDTDTVVRPPEGMLRRLLAERPHRERLHALLVRVHHAAGRRDEALAAFDRAGAALAADLGLDPGTELLEARRRVLADASTRSPVTADRSDGLPRAVAVDALGAAPSAGTLLGRHALLSVLVDRLRGAAAPVHVRGGPGAGVTALALAAARAVSDHVLVVGAAADGGRRRALLAEAADGPGDGVVLVDGAVPALVDTVLEELGGTGRPRVLLAGTHRLPGHGTEPVDVPGLDADVALALLESELAGARGRDDPSALRAAVAMSGGSPRLLVAGARSLAATPATPVASWVQEVTAPGPDGGPSRARRALDQLLGDRLAVLDPTDRLVLRGVGLHPPDRVPRAALAAALDLPLGAVSTALATLYEHGLLDRGPEGGHRPEEYRAPFTVWYHAWLTGEAEDDPADRVARVDRLLAHYGALVRSALDDRGTERGTPWEWLARHEPTLRALVHRWSARPACRAVGTALAEATASG